MRFNFFFLCVFFFFFNIYSNTPTIRGYSLGTKYNIIFKKKIKNNVKKKIEKIIKKTNKNLSNYNIKSKISIINECKKESAYKLNKEINFNLISAIKFKKLTNKNFNVDIKKNKKKNILINSLLVKKKVKKDLSAISKGYVLDKIKKKITKEKIKHFLIEIGGEIKTKKTKKKKKWTIEINIPKNKSIKKKHKAVFKMKNSSIATSGTYFNYLLDKNKFSHIINKKINKNILKDRLLSLSIVNKNCFVADSVATYGLIVGEKKIKNIKKKIKNLNYLLIYKNKNKIFIKKK